MGNCHASDAVAAVVEFPCGRIDKIYWSVTARQLMLQNPGHYVGVYVWPKAVVAAAAAAAAAAAKPKLKLLPPAAILNVGKCYRLVTYEEVIGDLTEGRGNIKIPRDAIKQSSSASKVNPETPTTTRNFKLSSVLQVVASQQQQAQSQLQYQQQQQHQHCAMVPSRAGQWRPSLQSISELGS